MWFPEYALRAANRHDRHWQVNGGTERKQDDAPQYQRTVQRAARADRRRRVVHYRQSSIKCARGTQARGVLEFTVAQRELGQMHAIDHAWGSRDQAELVFTFQSLLDNFHVQQA